MIRERKTFDRPDHTLIVDTTSGVRVVTRIPNGQPLPAPSVARRPSREASRKSPPAKCRYLGQPLTRSDGQPTTVKVACEKCGGLKDLDHPAFACELHGRCLPSFNPQRNALDMWQARKPESDIYHLCGQGRCDDFKPLVEISLKLQ